MGPLFVFNFLILCFLLYSRICFKDVSLMQTIFLKLLVFTSSLPITLKDSESHSCNHKTGLKIFADLLRKVSSCF